ncbi:hypothetical protein ACS0TY_011420 [Phlomoides rotata]
MPNMEQTSIFEDKEYKGVGIHSQVRKVKLEMEKINRQQPEEAKLALREITRRRSRSPLGLAEMPIPLSN